MFQSKDIKKLVQQALEKALMLFNTKRYDEVMVVLDQLLKVDNNHRAYQLKGLTYYSVQQFDEAIACFQKAMEIEKDNADDHNNIGLCYGSKGDHTLAVEHMLKAVKLVPGNASFWSNLGIAQRQLCQWDEAIYSLNKAVELKPEVAHFWCNLGGTYGEAKDLNNAERCFNKAIELKPDWGGAHVDLSHVCSLKGDWKKFWKEYEWRFQTYFQAKLWTRVYPRERAWNGRQSLKDKRLLLFCEQGAGDLIHFIRYVKLLPKCEVLIHCIPEMKRLMEQFGEVVSFDILDLKAQPPKYDYSASVMSLPYLLGVPPVPEPPYIKPNKFSLDYRSTFNIGICWAGNPQHPQDRHRSFALDLFSEINLLPGIKLFSMQKDVRPRKYAGEDTVYDLAAGMEGMKVVNMSPHMGDYQDTADIISSMDLIITADTALLHLAGALNKPCWALIPYNPDWRWKMEGENTIWYPSVRLFRAESKQSWAEPFAKILKELQNAPVLQNK